MWLVKSGVAIVTVSGYKPRTAQIPSHREIPTQSPDRNATLENGVDLPMGVPAYCIHTMGRLSLSLTSRKCIRTGD